MYAAKNHSEGPDKTVIDGTVTFEPGSTLNIESGAAIEGGRIAANQAASVATDVPGLVADFNALLTKLKAAGLMQADA